MENSTLLKRYIKLIIPEKAANMDKFNAIYVEKFSHRILPSGRKRRGLILKRWSNLVSHLEALENMRVQLAFPSSGSTINRIQGVVRNLVLEAINKAFPNCHELTKEYILSGYILGEGWDEELLNLLQDRKLNALDDELIFILFSTKMPVDDFFELSTMLPKSYLAKLLPTKNRL